LSIIPEPMNTNDSVKPRWRPHRTFEGKLDLKTDSGYSKIYIYIYIYIQIIGIFSGLLILFDNHIPRYTYINIYIQIIERSHGADHIGPLRVELF